MLIEVLYLYLQRKKRMMGRFLLLVISLAFCLSLKGQNTLAEKNIKENREPLIFRELDIHQDPELVRLIDLHIRHNETVQTINGFRVEIFFSSALDARQKALAVKSAFLREYPETSVYVMYVSPDFKVRVGNFRTKNEALYMMKAIQGKFPKAFIVPDLIEFPSLN